MLIQFTVKNYRSIREEQVLSMVKDKGDELAVNNAFLPDAPSSVSLLRSAVIYGSNAAGKSNVIKALVEMDFIVSHSASKNQEGDLISVTPFLFNGMAVKEPTEFEMVFISEGVKYQYGFSATKTQVVEEWLIAYPKSRPQRWFVRVFNSQIDAYEYKFSDHLLGQRSVWQNATRSNALLLSTAVQLNSDQLKPVYNWFKKKIRTADINGWGPSYTASLCETDYLKEEVLHFLKAADFDIHDIKVEKDKFDLNSLPDHFPQEVKEKIVTDMKGTGIVDIKTLHKTDAGDLVPLDFEYESDGTQKLFSFAGPWIDVLKNGCILVVDELHDSLHPKMVKYLVELFHNKKTNPKNAQLIFTTHETSILSQEIFRRDQIWFCEKDKSQATTLYPLSDFSPRKDKENIELGYLSGRYGALPFIKPFRDLCIIRRQKKNEIK